MLTRIRRGFREFKPGLILDALEERIVLDASVAPTTKDNADHSSDADGNVPASGAAATTAAPGTPADPAASPSHPAADVFGQDLRVVLISNAIDQIPGISQAVTEGAKVIVYDAAKDLPGLVADLKALVDSAGAGQKIGQLAFFTHGDPGVFNLTASAMFSAGTVTSNPGPWKDLGSLLAADARIDFYGCDLGKGPDGLAFVQAVATVTSSTVWASDDTTGSGPNADWVLEVKSSPNDRAEIVNTSFLETLPIILDNHNLTNAGFETNNFTGWTIGRAPVVLVDATTGGNYTGYDAGPSPYDAVSQRMARIDSQQGGGDSNQPSYLYQDFTYTYRDHIVFAYNFVSQETTAANDYFRYRLSEVGGGGTVAVDVFVYARDVPVVSGAFKATGWKTIDIDLTAYPAFSINDTLRLEIYAGNTNDTGEDSWAFVDFREYVREEPRTTGLIDRVVFEDAPNDTPDLDNWFTDPQGGGLTFSIVQAPDSALVAATINPTTHVLTLDYQDNAYGSTYMKVRATDIFGATAENGFTITVLPVKDTPTATSQSLPGWEGISTPVTVKGWDPDGHSASQVHFSLVGSPLGTLDTNWSPVTYDATTKTYSQTWLYTPPAGFEGTDSFDFVLVTPSGTWKGFEATNGTVIGAATPNMSSIDLAVGDFDQDAAHDLDIVASNSTSFWHHTFTGGTANNYFYRNNGGASFVAPVNMDATGGTAAGSMVVDAGDANGDGYPDIVVANDSTTVADMLYLWDPVNDRFKQGVAIPNSTAQGNGEIQFGDIDGDDRLDLVMGTNDPNERTYRNTGSGGYDQGIDLPLTATGITGTIAVGDLNGDGYLDIFCAKYDPGVATTTHVIYVNDGTGKFPTSRPLPTVGPGPASDNAALGDVDGDGDLDIVVGNIGTGNDAGSREVLFVNNGGWNFTPVIVDSGTNQLDTHCTRLADVDSDGDLDLVTTNYQQQDTVYLFNGTGFDAGRPIGTYANSPSLSGAVGDFDGDGDIDYVQGMIGQANRLVQNLGFNDYDSPTAQVDIQIGPFKNPRFQSDYDYWNLTETTIPNHWALGTVGIVKNGTTIGYLNTVHDYINNNDQAQHSFYFTSQGMPSSITVQDGSGDSNDLISVQLANGPRTSAIYQDIKVPGDSRVTAMELQWNMSYWNPVKPFNPVTQYVAMYVYDPTGPKPDPLWISTEGVDNPVVGSMAPYHKSVSVGHLGKIVRVEFDIVSKDGFLHAAIDDFRLTPTAFLAGPVVSPLVSPSAFIVSTPMASSSAGDGLSTAPWSTVDSAGLLLSTLSGYSTLQQLMPTSTPSFTSAPTGSDTGVASGSGVLLDLAAFDLTLTAIVPDETVPAAPVITEEPSVPDEVPIVMVTPKDAVAAASGPEPARGEYDSDPLAGFGERVERADDGHISRGELALDFDEVSAWDVLAVEPWTFGVVDTPGTLIGLKSRLTTGEAVAVRLEGIKFTDLAG